VLLLSSSQHSTLSLPLPFPFSSRTEYEEEFEMGRRGQSPSPSRPSAPLPRRPAAKGEDGEWVETGKSSSNTTSLGSAFPPLVHHTSVARMPSGTISGVCSDWQLGKTSFRRHIVAVSSSTTTQSAHTSAVKRSHLGGVASAPHNAWRWEQEKQRMVTWVERCKSHLEPS
jgi:hypothetical protein